MRRTAPRPRPQLALSLLVSALVVLTSACGGQAAGATAQGKLAWPKDGDLWVYDMATRKQTKITNLPQGAAVTGASWSPDGKRVVFSQFWRRPNERSSGADLMVADADGSHSGPFAERDAANTVLEGPQWAASGHVYYTARRVASGRESQVVLRQSEGGQPEAILDNAYNATVSADEKILVYLRNTRAGQSLMRKSLTESGDGCELLSDVVFQYLSLPRLSPDGKRVALGGSGEPNLQGPSGCGGDPKAKPAAAAPLGALADLLAPQTAEAHGLPADVYTLNADGSALTRVADIKDDDPTVAWSPDGQKLAIFGVAALFLVDGKGGSTEKLVDQGGYGGIDWTR